MWKNVDKILRGSGKSIIKNLLFKRTLEDASYDPHSSECIC